MITVADKSVFQLEIGMLNSFVLIFKVRLQLFKFYLEFGNGHSDVAL